MNIILAAFIGFFASFISSTFGGGAGLITVPALYWLFYHTYGANMPVMQMTLTTGAMIAVPLGIMATWRQLHYANVEFVFLKRFTLTTCMGAIASALLIHHVNTHFLKYFFAAMILLTAIWFYFHNPDRHPPWQYRVVLHQPLAFLVGLVSVLIGTSIFTVPFFMKLGLDIKKAVGTASVVVFVYSVVGAVGLVLVSLHAPNLPRFSLGYLNVPVFLATIIPSLLGSFIAVKFVHHVNPAILKKLFLAMMLIVSASMLVHV